MLKEKRFEYILRELESKDMVTYEGLSMGLAVSEDTIRRDIAYLHKNGLISKVRGGAILRVKNPMSFQDRRTYLQKEKDVIALKAQQQIRRDMTIFMDGGTTTCAIANYFPPDIKLRIITNNQMLVPIFMELPHVDLVILGGAFDRDTATTAGAVTCQEIAQYIADLYFMGACAVDGTHGISAMTLHDADVKKAMLSCSKKTVTLANHDQLRRTESFKVCNMEQIEVLITDLPSDHAELDEFRHFNIQLL